MNAQTKTNLLQTYQVVVYDRALHPEHFALKGRRVQRQGEYELETWVMPGAHLLRFECRGLCACELLTDQDRNLPAAGVVGAFLAAGERDYEHRFLRDRINYMTTVQTETLSDNLYAATYEEMLDFAKDAQALAYQWSDDTGKCLTVVDVQKMNREVHAQAYHLVASIGLVIRSQSIFEVK